MKRGEIISLHLGQAGVQIGNAVWELFCMEHMVYPDGRLADPSEEGNEVLFYETSAGQHVPRVVMADLEPSCIDEIRVGAYRNLFGTESMISGKEDAASNFARGYYSIGNEMSELCCERVRKQAEKCSSLQGIAIFRSLGGGTGSGFGANIMSKLQRDLGRVPLVEFAVFPSPRISPIIVEPYNAVLTSHSTINSGSCTFFFDNESIYDICDKHLKVSDPTYTNLNRLLAQVVSGVTAAVRFPGTMNIQLNDFLTNLVPFPRLHFPLVSFSPFLPCSRIPYESMASGELIREAFSAGNQMIKCDPRAGAYIACILFMRGDVPPGDVDKAIGDIKEVHDIRFVDYSPSGFKVGHSPRAVVHVPGSDLGPLPRSMVMIANSSVIGASWERLNSKFGIMFEKRAFVHHYVGEGLEENEFTESHEDLKQLAQDYKQAGS